MTVKEVRAVRRPRNATPTKIEPVDHSNIDTTPCIEFNTSLSNFLPYSIYVVDRSGIVSKIPCKNHNPLRKSGVDIVRSWTFSRGVTFDSSGLLGVTSGQEYQAIRDAYLTQKARRDLGDRYNVDVLYQLSEGDFNAVGKNAYMHEADIVITAEDPAQFYCHPGSEGTLRSLKASGEAYSTYWQVAVVDNRAEHQKLFVNLNGSVYSVIPERNPGLKDGVYTYTRNRLEDVTSDIQCRHFTFERAFKELPIFPTTKQAEDYGNLEQRMERELEIRKNTLKLELTQKEAEVKAMALENAKQKELNEELTCRQEQIAREWEERHAIHKREHEEKMARVKRENDAWQVSFDRAKAERDLELQRIKDHYENRSHVRKDTSESIKHLPLIIGGLFTAAALWTKL